MNGKIDQMRLLVALSCAATIWSCCAAAQTLETNSAAACNFASSRFGIQVQRQVKANLSPAENYNYGEVYGQIYFDFRKKGASLPPEHWFDGFRGALTATGLFSENKEYLLVATAFAHLYDRDKNASKRTEIGQQILYRFTSGREGNIQLIGVGTQSGNRTATTANGDGLFTLTPRFEVIEPTNLVDVEFQFYKSKHPHVDPSIFRTILSELASVASLPGVVTFPPQQPPTAIVDAATKPIQDADHALSEHFEPIESLARVRSIGFIPNIKVSGNNVATYSAEVSIGGQNSLHEIRVYAAVIPSIVANRLDDKCRYPKYDPDPHSILRAAVTPTNVTVETFYKHDNLRRTYLNQLGRQAAREDLIEACNTIKQDVRRYFGGFDAYAIGWALFASREKQFRDKNAARDCFTSDEQEIIYKKLMLPVLWDPTSPSGFHPKQGMTVIKPGTSQRRQQ